MMNINILDRNKNFNILFAGILSITISLGVARFAFTSLLPSMLDDFLTLRNAGIFASVNFAGYLCGALFTIFIKDINKKVIYFRLGVAICFLMTLVLAFSTNETIWLISRIVSGFGSGLLLVIGGAIVMEKITYENKTKAMGIHFSGIGIGIVVCEVISQYSLLDGTWVDGWKALCIYAFIASLYITHILSFDKEVKKSASTQKMSFSIFTPYVILIILAYLTEGVGFVIQGTFLPDIINSLDGLDGYGSLGWLIVGLSGIPSCIIWMRLAHKHGSINIIMIAMLVQVIAILIPALTNNMYLNLFSGALYGGTFVGLVALFMNLGGQISKNNPVVLMGALTAFYGLGQVIAPLYSIKLIDIFGNYDTTMYLTAFIVVLGVMLLVVAKKIEKRYTTQ